MALGLTVSFTVPTVAPPAPVPFRTFFPLPFPPVLLPFPEPTDVIVPDELIRPLTPAAEALPVPVWLEETRLSGGVAHFKSMLFGFTLLPLLFNTTDGTIDFCLLISIFVYTQHKYQTRAHWVHYLLLFYNTMRTKAATRPNRSLSEPLWYHSVISVSCVCSLGPYSSNQLAI